MNSYCSKKIIVTRRVWQCLAAIVLVILLLWTRYYPFPLAFGCRLGGLIFFIIFSSAYWREERRAVYLPDSNMVINWNLVEALLLFLSLVAFLLFAYCKPLSGDYFYAYIRTAALALLSGVGMGEFFWQNTRLRQFDQIYRDRYWACYKDSIF